MIKRWLYHVMATRRHQANPENQEVKRQAKTRCDTLPLHDHTAPLS
jgi:hypothetical protein